MIGSKRTILLNIKKQCKKFWIFSSLDVIFDFTGGEPDSQSTPRFISGRSGPRIHLGSRPSFPEIFARLTVKMSQVEVEKDQRRIQRYSLALPARVEVKVDEKFTWNEVTRIEDVSAFGAGFTLTRPVKRGRLLSLSAPLPRQLRCFDFLDPQYKVWGLVRRCIPLGHNPVAQKYGVGIAFIGKTPPQSYLENPSKLYEISTRDDGGLWMLIDAPSNPDENDLPGYLRRHTRFSIPESLLLEVLDENGDVVASEVTVTENISLGGAGVFTSFYAETGSVLRVTSDRHNNTLIAIVRGRRLGPDGVVRLHIEFVDRMFPLEGIEAESSY